MRGIREFAATVVTVSVIGVFNAAAIAQTVWTGRLAQTAIVTENELIDFSETRLDLARLSYDHDSLNVDSEGYRAASGEIVSGYSFPTSSFNVEANLSAAVGPPLPTFPTGNSVSRFSDHFDFMLDAPVPFTLTAEAAPLGPGVVESLVKIIGTQITIDSISGSASPSNQGPGFVTFQAFAGTVEIHGTIGAGPGIFQVSNDLRLEGVQGSTLSRFLNASLTLGAVSGILGDFNNDALVNVTDIELLCDAIDAGGPNDPFDVNGDGSVTNADMTYEVETILDTNFGDTDLDGDVDLADLGNLATGFGPGESLWARGNFDCDDDVDLNDLGVLATNYGAGRARAFADFAALDFGELSRTVPEPAGASALALTALGALRRSRWS